MAKSAARSGAVVRYTRPAQRPVGFDLDVVRRSWRKHRVQMRRQCDERTPRICVHLGDHIAGAIDPRIVAERAKLRDHPIGAFAFEKCGRRDAADLKVLLVDPQSFSNHPLQAFANARHLGEFGDRSDIGRAGFQRAHRPPQCNEPGALSASSMILGKTMRVFAVLLLSLGLAAVITAQVKPIPPPGVEVSAADRTQLEAGLRPAVGQHRPVEGCQAPPGRPDLPRCSRFALENGEFFKPEEVASAKELLREGQKRADDLQQGRAPWTTATGLVVRGYVSKIDKSVQPYGLVIPAFVFP